jgi:hypothetical protein
MHESEHEENVFENGGGLVFSCKCSGDNNWVKMSKCRRSL